MMSAIVIYPQNAEVTVPNATSTTKGIMNVPSGYGLYVSNGSLYANIASTGQRGMVQLAQDGGLEIDSNSRIRVRDATNVRSGKVMPDNETITIEDGVISAARTGPYWDVRTDRQGRRRLAIVIPEED